MCDCKPTENTSSIRKAHPCLSGQQHGQQSGPQADPCEIIRDLLDVIADTRVNGLLNCHTHGYKIDRANEYLTNPQDDLRQRITDICSGAVGGVVGPYETLDLEDVSRILPAILDTWPSLPDYVSNAHNLHHFKHIDKITMFISEALEERPF
jgi:hypothetical protein